MKNLSNPEETFEFRNVRPVNGRIFTLDIYTGFCFFKKLIPVVKMNKKWSDNFKSNTVFFPGRTKSCDVLISYIGRHNFFVNNRKTDNDGRILIGHDTVNDAAFLLINLDNGNTETKKVSVLNNLSSLLENFDITLEKKINFSKKF